MTAITAKQLAQSIEQTLLTPTATAEDVRRCCEQAKEHGFHAVCANSRWLPAVADALHGSGVKACGVVSLPLGADSTKIKAAVAKEVIFLGADELDVVADLAAVIESDVRYLSAQLQAVLRVCRSVRPAVTLKVIIESAALTLDQKMFACQVAQQAGVDFIKTSTGMHPAGGATVEDVKLIKDMAPRCRVKAAGGISSANKALAMLQAGASRIGTSSGVKIMEEFKAGRSIDD